MLFIFCLDWVRVFGQFRRGHYLHHRRPRPRCRRPSFSRRHDVRSRFVPPGVRNTLSYVRIFQRVLPTVRRTIILITLCRGQRRRLPCCCHRL
jgi:hypothetical protein